MRILIAPDKFKGSLSAREVAENIELGLRGVLRDAEIAITPMADGGEGTAEVICNALGGSWVKCKAHDPLGREIDARYAWIANRKLAVMEMSQTAGMRRLSESERDPLRANTFGVGEMILDGARHGAREIIIGLGGSATNDGGFGMARALGFRFFADAKELTGAVGELQKLTEIEALVAAGVSPANSTTQPTRLPPQLKIVAAVDVQNPLLGENGATRVFGPQKGATDDKIDVLERALAKLAEVVSKEFGIDYRDEPGAGAAGGLGFGLVSFCGAKIRPGFEVVAEAADLESKMENFDLVITGEGSLDRQTLEGKTAAGIARLARKLGKSVFAVAGCTDGDRRVRDLFDGVYVLGQPGMSENEKMKRSAELLREEAQELAKSL
ncbi:MAG TPA: glycerate kinase [Candidatus Udaeobacter sp.]|jgi:glycerate kinase|nr:glycerate kinase [Candidatus Udaeobacter sp.]